MFDVHITADYWNSSSIFELTNKIQQNNVKVPREIFNHK